MAEFSKSPFAQGIMVWIISAPLLSAQSGPRTTHLISFDILGTALWLLGFFFESMGGLQLAQFEASSANKGKVMDRGI